MIPGKQYTHEEILRIAWRRKWFAAVPMFIAGLAAIGYARSLPNRYKAETLIVLVPQRVPESYVRSTVTTRIEDRLQSISQQILSRTRLERIIQDFNLYQDLRRTSVMEDVIERMRTNDIDVQVIKGDSFRVGYVSDDARRAMQVSERLASLFIDENLKDREVLAEGTNRFLEAQLQDAKRRLIEVEKKIEDYRRQHLGELPTQLDSNVQAMNGSQMQLQSLLDSLNRDRDRRLVLERTLADLSAQLALPALESSTAPTAVGTVEQPGAQGATYAQQLDAARRLLRDLEMRLKPAHPDLARVKRAVVDLEKKVAAEADAAVAGLAVPIGETETSAQSKASADIRADTLRRARQTREDMADIDRQIAAKEAEQLRLKQIIADYQKRVEGVPTRESELTELTRDYATLQTLYSSLLSKNEEAKISTNLERRQSGEQFKVLDPARLPERPFSPDRPRIIGIGALFGLGLGVGLAALLEYRDTTLKTRDDVITALALPVLALVPLMRSTFQRPFGRKRMDVAITRETSRVDAPPFNPALAGKLVSSADVKNATVEQYRLLAATLHHAQSNNGTKVVMVASAAAGEGKTLTAVNLALTLSTSYARRVLLIDADLRRPMLDQVFQVPNRSGLNDSIKANTDGKLTFIEISRRLSLLPAGLPDPNPISGLTSGQMQRIIAEAEEAFDWVVLDTPPISLITDARLLAAMVHAAVLVVRAGSTPCALIQQAIETLDRSRVIGVVLNCVEERSVLPGGKYGKYYSSYYDRPANARVDVQPQASTRL